MLGTESDSVEAIKKVGCVQVIANVQVCVRDSKNTDGPVLALTARHGLAFLGAVKSNWITR